jgi:aspartyl-tRNA(Asn)/glutamyl-tRNA(Gln) amidotransferase subunit A
MTDLTTVTATELSSLYQSGAASPVTVAHQVLAKIAQINPILNAFCFTDPETTLAQAHASEQRWRQGQPLSAMDGVPVAIKDSILTQGWPTLHASLTVDPNQHWNKDAPAIARLREAGAVFAGKTTMSEFGGKITTDSLLYGITRNPWNIKCSPGGSSGGSAVAVASGLTPIALGTDYSGSVRIPAAFCGVVGFKPTHEVIDKNVNSLFNCGCVGQLARSVDDVMLMMGINADSLDMSKIRIAYSPNFGFAKSINYEVEKSIAHVAQTLSLAGAKVTEIDRLCDDPTNILGSIYAIDTTIRWNQFDNYQKQAIGITGMPDIKLTDCFVLEDLIKKTKIQQYILQQQLKAFATSYDIILSPSTAVTADTFLAHDTESDQTYGSAAIKYIPFSYLFNITGQPAVSVPVGVNHLGMPIGVQLAGAIGADVLVLQLAQIIEKHFPMPPCPVIL